MMYLKYFYKILNNTAVVFFFFAVLGNELSPHTC
jgi:hypothetical protein